MVNSMWRRFLFDVRVKRGVDVCSDYYFVIVKVRLKFRVVGLNKYIIVRYDISRL